MRTSSIISARCSKNILVDSERGDETPIKQGDGLDRCLSDGTRAAARHAPAHGWKMRDARSCAAGAKTKGGLAGIRGGAVHS